MERFTPDQIREYNDAFVMFDKENRGSIPCGDLREMLKLIGYNPTDQLLEELTIVVDDGNGRLDFSEFIALVDRLESDEKHTKEARDAFNAFDFTGLGYVAANDIKEALMHIMEKASDEDKEHIIKHFRLEKNRKITFEEFKYMLTITSNASK